MTPAADRLPELLQRAPLLTGCRTELLAAADAMVHCARAGKTLFFCGNGGSHADAEHIVGELLKRFCRPRPLPPAEQAALKQAFGGDGAYLAQQLQGGIRAAVLGLPASFASAMANDVAAELALAQHLYAVGSAGDLLVGISTSGNAANVAHALRVARLKGIARVGLTGRTGGRLAALCDICLRVPADEPAPVQELHVLVYHWLCAVIEHEVFG